MSEERPLWISEREVASLLDLGGAIAALERGLALQARGYAANLEKTQLSFGKGDTLHALGAVFAGEGLAGTKTWAHTAGGATPLLVLFDARDGALVAIVEAFALGQLRTSAASAIATDRLAARDADELALLGSGKQALGQAAAVHAVRPLRRIRVWSPSAERRRAFASLAAKELGVVVDAAASLREATDGARVVTTVTRARQPFVQSSLLARGAHVNAVGAIGPERAELAPDVFARVRLAVADAPADARRLSAELRGWLGPDEKAWRRVLPLSALVAGVTPDADSDSGDLTLFKAMGMGISDLALGADVLARARREGAGRPLDPPARVAPRFTALARR